MTARLACLTDKCNMAQGITSTPKLYNGRCREPLVPPTFIGAMRKVGA